jgi:hypothetical protein
LKKIGHILIFLLLANIAGAQTLYLHAEGSNSTETKVIDSLSYQKKHTGAKAVADEAKMLYSRLTQLGYLQMPEPSWLKTNDSTFVYSYRLGQRIKNIHITTKRLSEEQKALLEITKDTIIIATASAEAFMNDMVGSLEKKGYPLSSAQLLNHRLSGTSLYAELAVKNDKKRNVDNIVIEGYQKFPDAIRRNIARQYRNRTFNRETLEKIYKDFGGLRFVSQTRYSEILFKKDTTKVYVYLEKAKANTFDGFIGFSNNEEKGSVRFNGYIDLLLNNILNSGEKFSLFWKSDGNKQTTFNTALELPYIFGTPLGVKGSLRIFKQDSTFQNTVTDINLGYYFNYNSRFFAGHQKTQSVDIQNQEGNSLSDFTTTFWTGSYEYAGYADGDFLFPQRTSLSLRGGTGKRSTKTGATPQNFAQVTTWHNIYLNKRNIINLKNQTFFLGSSSYIINELFRFGGINSIRGFNENSLQANLYTALMAEYRYVLSPGMYVHSITDYGYFQDKTSGLQDNLLSFGFGLGMLTKNGMFNLVYANGSTGSQQIKLSNSIVHVSFRINF